MANHIRREKFPVRSMAIACVEHNPGRSETECVASFRPARLSRRTPGERIEVCPGEVFRDKFLKEKRRSNGTRHWDVGGIADIGDV